MQFQKALISKATKDDKNSDASSFIEHFQDINMPDPEIIKIGPFCKALPNSFPLILGFAIVSQKYKELRCQCSKVMTGWSNKYGLENISCPRPQNYTPRGMLQRVSAIGIYFVYHTAIKVYLEQLYFNDQKRLRKSVIPITPSTGHSEKQAPDKKRKHIDQASNARTFKNLTIRHASTQAPDTQSEALKQLIDLRKKLESELNNISHSTFIEPTVNHTG